MIGGKRPRDDDSEWLIVGATALPSWSIINCQFPVARLTHSGPHSNLWPVDTTAPAARLQVTAPKLMRAGGLLVVCGYGLLLMVPVIASVLIVSVLNFSWLTWVIPLLTFAAATALLPLGFGNPHIARIGRALAPPVTGQTRYLVQLSFNPRLRFGWRGLLDDADDIGWLSITSSTLEFSGDSVRLVLPISQAREVCVRSIGLRGLFLYQRVGVRVANLGDVKEVWFAERSSWLLSTSRRTTNELWQKIKASKDGITANG